MAHPGCATTFGTLTALVADQWCANTVMANDALVQMYL
ncbi:unnamed protein product [Tetraodon nigroviridis]|uniref:(spotted green pufferfish) hypothetical protein n=1 Tax=Tetraodon nigroviridis TaxID=99883 RepID=Q4T4U2_TETNG|nr:unnamed protein product [Tetraodon nigroviridis]